MTRRSTTLAFRISLAERALIDEQAQSCAMNNSDFARRAVVDAARIDAAALASAREEGRDEARSMIRQLAQDLAHAQTLAVGWQQRSAALTRQLSQSSEDLVSASQAVLSGDADAKVTVATIWARLGGRQRLKLLPIVAAAAEREFEQSVRPLPISQAWVDAGLEFLARVRWLIDALDPDAGDEYAIRATGSRRNSPLEGALNRLIAAVLVGREAVEREAAAAAVDAASAGEAVPAWAKGLVWGYSQ